MTKRDKNEKKGTTLVWIFLRIYMPGLLLFSGYQFHLHSHTKPTVIYQSKLNRAQHLKRRFYRGGGGNVPKRKQTPSFAIFYNAFINPANYNQSLRIIKEQLTKVQNSTHRNTPIYYNIIGQKMPDTRICPYGMNCHRMRYLPQGEEVLTLQDLYEYCVDHPLHAVVYLHDKGSFNPSGNNHRIRKLATASAVSKACRNAMHLPATTTTAGADEQQQCNVCANKFKFLPNHHTPGAMWTGNCSYLKTLIPPKDFDARRQEMFRAVRDNETLQQKLHCVKKLVENFEEGKSFGGDQWKYMSIQRYAMEHWAFSSPDLQPCVTVPKTIMGIDSKKWQPNLTVGVGVPSFSFERATATGWYQMEGRKWEYQYLYGRLPPPSSFFWKIYSNVQVPEENKISC